MDKVEIWEVLVMLSGNEISLKEAHEQICSLSAGVCCRCDLITKTLNNNEMDYQKLFDYMKDEHGVTLLESDMQEIRNIVCGHESQQCNIPDVGISLPKRNSGEMWAFLLVNALRCLNEEQRAGLCFDLYSRNQLTESIDERIRKLKEERQ